ncbi:MAG: AAA family ATPase [Chloroflexi bacterium]|nr:AAA family ATPase [Chloroflexota bacterium]
MILEDKIAQDIKELHGKLTAEDKLVSKAQLAVYCDTFVKRFGPDKLGGLDGEALLQTMHAHGNRDSLVYWLEFKNDDEFPAIFGGIGGGSALKFGIYRRKDTGAWMTGSSKDQRELSPDQAIEFARKHRDQLLRGCQLLDKLPIDASEAEYVELQRNMYEVAPEVSRLAWGHKYFCLIHRDKLDDYHRDEYQRFHLIKMLQVPPDGDGKYIVGGRFAAIARELEIPLNHLTAILNSRNGRPYRYWRIGVSDGTQLRNRWEMMRDGGCVAVGWPKLGNLSEIIYNRDSKEKVRNSMANHYPGPTSVVGRSTQQVFSFLGAMGEGDVVLASNGKAILGVGKVLGGYEFEPSSDFPHRRRVQWLSLHEWEFAKPEGLRTVVQELGKYLANLVDIERRILEGSSKPISSTIAGRTVQHLEPLTGVPGRIQAVLERKGQAILYGPPGTGKTYWAELAACELAARSSFRVPFTQLTSEQKFVVVGDGTNSCGLVRICCFHPAYGYEDFIEGYRPEQINGRMVFSRRDGVFKKLCDDAQARPNDHFYLIIDEINRGDIPRIFGELLTVLEKNKRGKSMLLPLSGLPFKVPSNVFVIGTMNTADRSIALLDTALRRRFGFIELMPDSSVLANALVGDIPLGLWLDALNSRLCVHIGRDARNLQIGHSYFLDEGHSIKDFSKFSRVIREDIVPLLEEYCYEDYSTLEKILGNGLIDAKGQRVRHELFDTSRRDDLVLALLAPCPEISASLPAIASEVDNLGEEVEENDDEPVSDGV